MANALKCRTGRKILGVGATCGDGTSYSPAKLLLNDNGRMVLKKMPCEFGEEICIMTGTGRWRQSGGPGDLSIDFIYTADAGIANVCKSGHYGGPELAGQSTPYSLYWLLGDPDRALVCG